MVLLFLSLPSPHLHLQLHTPQLFHIQLLHNAITFNTALSDTTSSTRDSFQTQVHQRTSPVSSDSEPSSATAFSHYILDILDSELRSWKGNFTARPLMLSPPFLRHKRQGTPLSHSPLLSASSSSMVNQSCWFYAPLSSSIKGKASSFLFLSSIHIQLHLHNSFILNSSTHDSSSRSSATHSSRLQVFFPQEPHTALASALLWSSLSNAWRSGLKWKLFW